MYLKSRTNLKWIKIIDGFSSFYNEFVNSDFRKFVKAPINLPYLREIQNGKDHEKIGNKDLPFT